jgi:hypothetical protein
VRIKTPARIKRIIATAPEMRLAKYKPAITIATNVLTTLSAIPMFFFIVDFLVYELSHRKSQPM